MITDKVTDLRIIENEQIQLATFKQGWINTAYDFVFFGDWAFSLTAMTMV